MKDKLSDAKIEQYCRDGFLLIEGILDSQQNETINPLIWRR